VSHFEIAAEIRFFAHVVLADLVALADVVEPEIAQASDVRCFARRATGMISKASSATQLICVGSFD
jgi:hypothetical protein